jgi:hypothetical protein
MFMKRFKWLIVAFVLFAASFAAVVFVSAKILNYPDSSKAIQEEPAAPSPADAPIEEFVPDEDELDDEVLGEVVPEAE